MAIDPLEERKRAEKRWTEAENYIKAANLSEEKTKEQPLVTQAVEKLARQVFNPHLPE